jgi:hypothetical protein
MAHDIVPDYVVVVDANPLISRYVQSEVLDYGKAKLVVTPLVDPDLVKNWRGERIWYLPRVYKSEVLDDNECVTIRDFRKKYKPKPEDKMALYYGSTEAVFIDQILRHAYIHNYRLCNGGINYQVMNGGSSPANAMLIAGGVMGCCPLFLVGADLCYLKGKTRATGYRYDFSTRTFNSYSRFRTEYGRKDKEKEGKKTNHVLEYEKIGYLTAGHYEGMQVFEVGDGLLDYYPKITIEELIQTQGKGFEDRYLEQKERLKKFNTWCNENLGREILKDGEIS